MTKRKWKGEEAIIVEWIRSLADVPPRSTKAAHESRRKYLDAVDQTMTVSRPIGRPWSLKLAFNLAALFLFVFIVGTGVVSAAGSALPGDALYPLKNRIENVRSDFISDPGDKLRFHLELAERRISEMEMLASKGSFEPLMSVVGNYQNQLALAAAELAKLSNRGSASTDFRNALLNTLERLGVLVCALPADQTSAVQLAIRETLRYLPDDTSQPECAEQPAQTLGGPADASTPTPWTAEPSTPAVTPSPTLIAPVPTGTEYDEGGPTQTPTPGPTATEEDGDDDDGGGNGDGEPTPEPTDENGDGDGDGQPSPEPTNEDGYGGNEGY